VDHALDLTTHWIDLAAVATFLAAYGAVMAEEYLQLRKSQPVLLAAGVVWLLIGLAYAQAGAPEGATAAAEHNLLEFAELFLFLLVAMTYVNTLEERGLFDALLVWQAGHVAFFGFFALVVPALVNWLVPATIMAFAVEPGRPAPLARLRRELASPAALRRAIVVREVLGPPKGLR
jgi:Na+/H+ antiporter NhaD/arsenite permease-like protein